MVVKRGFSIAEALIACTLVSGIAVCLFGVWAMHAKATNHSRDMLVASAWAEQLMEGELSKGYTAVSDPAVQSFHVTHIVADQAVDKEYVYRVYVTDSNNPTAPGLKTVRVEVCWEHQGQWRTWHVVTQLSWQG